MTHPGGNPLLMCPVTMATLSHHVSLDVGSVGFQMLSMDEKFNVILLCSHSYGIVFQMGVRFIKFCMSIAETTNV